MAFFGASCDTQATNKKFSDKLDLNFPLLSDTNKQVAGKYGILMRGIFPKRVTIYVNKDGKIAYIETKVSIAQAGKQVTDRLAALKIEKRVEKSDDQPTDGPGKADKDSTKKK